jgi:hypothetical protein
MDIQDGIFGLSLTPLAQMTIAKQHIFSRIPEPQLWPLLILHTLDVRILDLLDIKWCDFDRRYGSSPFGSPRVRPWEEKWMVLAFPTSVMTLASEFPQWKWEKHGLSFERVLIVRITYRFCFAWLFIYVPLSHCDTRQFVLCCCNMFELGFLCLFYLVVC